jgi:hypothetical protein
MGYFAREVDVILKITLNQRGKENEKIANCRFTVFYLFATCSNGARQPAAEFV